jgi:hypothetical protein
MRGRRSLAATLKATTIQLGPFFCANKNKSVHVLFEPNISIKLPQKQRKIFSALSCAWSNNVQTMDLTRSPKPEMHDSSPLGYWNPNDQRANTIP